MEKLPNIHVVAPAGAVNKTNVQKGIKYLKTLGLACTPGKSIFSQNGYLAGTDINRLADLQTALDDSTAAAIWAARGGYGTTRIIDQVRWNKFFKKPCWLIGFSDITTLHIHLSNNGIPSIHGALVSQGCDEKYYESIKLVASILKNELPEYMIRSSKYNRTGKTKAPITGGNLTLICSTIGTATEIITDNKILFIEEVNEAAYHIDRMMVQLKRAGKLKKLKGLIIGHMTNINEEKKFGKSFFEIVLEHTKEYAFPICFQFPAGHDLPNMPLILGRKSELIVEKSEVHLRYL